MRLIDADALKETLCEFMKNNIGIYSNEMLYLVDNAPTQVVSNEKINCPKDLNQYLICEPIFENTFSPDDCESRKFYGDCYHCFASAIAKRDRQIRENKE